MLFDNLFPSRQTIASAHDEIMTDRHNPRLRQARLGFECNRDLSPLTIPHRAISETRDILRAARYLQHLGFRSDADQVDRTQIPQSHGQFHPPSLMPSQTEDSFAR